MNQKELRKLVNYAISKHNMDEETANTILTDEGAARDWVEGGECAEDCDSDFPYK